MDDFEKQLKATFLDEATQNLDSCEKCFLDLESDNDDASGLETIFRLAHNLKGAARTAGFNDIADFTHELENLLIKFRTKELPVSPSAVDLLLECHDFLRLAIGILRADMNAKIDTSEIVVKIQKHISNQNVSVDSPPADNESNAQLKANNPETVEENKIDPNRHRITSDGEDSIRVKLERLERLNDFAGELVILQAMLNQQTETTISPSTLKVISQLNKITKEIQNIAMACRMVPLQRTLQKLKRVVRDTSRHLDKSVNLIVEGGGTEIDKTIEEPLGNSLMHIIRNAVDHGVEPVEERVSAGKSESANLRISAYHKGSQLIIEIQDDGRGLDEVSIQNRAVSLGLVDAHTKLTSSEIQQLIFMPGFSTKVNASDISGRGVGLDAVKAAIQQLSGEIWLQTEKGKGTTFRIQLPLTVAIAEGLIIVQNQQKYVVPLNQIFQTTRLKDVQIRTIVGKGKVMLLRDETIPLFYLGELLQHDGTNQETAKLALIVREQDRIFAVAVENVVRQQQVVIKQIGQEVKNHANFMGGAILGDGKPALILDLHKLVGRNARVMNLGASIFHGTAI